MRRLLAFGFLLSTFGWADPGLLKIVSSNISPDVKAGSFASKPRTVYRQGAYLARVEEVDDPVDRVHMVVIRSHSEGWTVDLRNKVARHSQGLPEEVRVPVIPVGPLAALEFGHELEFMRSHKVQLKQGVYLYRQDPYQVRLLVKGGKPALLEASEKGKLLLRLRYDQYLSGLPANPGLFQVPAGFQMTE